MVIDRITLFNVCLNLFLEPALSYENFDLDTIVTPVNYLRLEQLLKLTSYDPVETQYIIDGFKSGFDIGYRGPIEGIHRYAPNLKLNVGSHVQLWNKIMKEVKLKRYAGPYSQVPFQSPVGLVAKSNGDTRLIFHLSYPHTGDSINSLTPPELCSVKYSDFSEAIIRCLEEGENSAIAKTDMVSAFRQLGVKKSQWRLLIIKAYSPIDGKLYYFVEKALSFGASISCSHFQQVSNCLAHITKVITQKSPVNYLDDYLFASLLRSLCNAQVQTFLDICEYVNFPVSLEKSFWVTSVLMFLGLLINTKYQYVAIPVDKIQRAKDLIENILMNKSKKTMVRTLQKVTGYLNFLCRAVVPGCTFLRRLYFHFSSEMAPHHHVWVNKDMRADLETWMSFLNKPTVYCRPFLDFESDLHPDQLDWYTDASGVIRFGGICGNAYFKGFWPRDFIATQKPSIEYLELYAVAVSVLLWVKNFANKRICIFVDNDSIRRMLNKSTTKCKNCLVLIRLIVLECVTWNVRLFAEHVVSAKNNFADALLRNQMARFHLDAMKEFDELPETIPRELWPIEKIWLKL